MNISFFKSKKILMNFFLYFFYSSVYSFFAYSSDIATQLNIDLCRPGSFRFKGICRLDISDIYSKPILPTNVFDNEEINWNLSDPLGLSKSSAEIISLEKIREILHPEKIKILRLAFQNIDTILLEEISTRFTKLHTLDISNTKIIDNDLINLNNIRGLKTLILGNNQLSDIGIKKINLNLLSELEELNMRNTKVTEDVLNYLKSSKSIKKLDFRHTAFTKQWDCSLAGIVNLQEILFSAEEKEKSHELISKNLKNNIKVFYAPSLNLPNDPFVSLKTEQISKISSKDKYKSISTTI